MYSRRIESIEYREIKFVTTDVSIYESAKYMADKKISCLFIKDQKGKIVGFVTDITLRNNVIAKQVDTNSAVGDIMDNPIVSIDAKSYIYEALLMMFRTKTSYMLIQKEDGVHWVS